MTAVSGTRWGAAGVGDVEECLGGVLTTRASLASNSLVYVGGFGLSHCFGIPASLVPVVFCGARSSTFLLKLSPRCPVVLQRQPRSPRRSHHLHQKERQRDSFLQRVLNPEGCGMLNILPTRCRGRPDIPGGEAQCRVSRLSPGPGYPVIGYRMRRTAHGSGQQYSSHFLGRGKSI